MIRKCILLSLVLGAYLRTNAQIMPGTEQDSTGRIHYGLGASAIATTEKQVPFWMRSNQYGSIPLAGLSASFSGFAARDYKIDEAPKLIDWGAGIDGRLNLGNRAQAILVEAYLKARLSIFQLKAGRSRDYMGIADAELSSGNFAVSGNALGIPKIELSVPEYWNLPLTKGLISVKGNFAFGTIGILPTESNDNMPGADAKTFYHQKSFYGRLGKNNWKIKLIAGFNHQVFWGDENRYFYNWNISPLQTAIKAITGGVNYQTKVGNHIGSIDQAIVLDLKTVTVKGYHEFFYDVGGLYHLNNIKDGLWGLSFERRVTEANNIGWSKILFEFLNTKSQGGEPDAKITPSGDENYYNGMYMEGWTYKRINLGSPLLTNRENIRKDLPTGSYKDFIVNNRVTAFHAAFQGYYKQWSFLLKATYTINYGTWGSSPLGHSGGDVRTPLLPPYFTKVNQFSAYIEASRPLKKNYRIGFVLAGDYGDLLYNSLGGMIKLTRTW